MKNKLKKIGQAVHKRLSLRVIVGGRTGMVAWGLSGAGAVAVLIWGVKLIAVPLLMVKTASWGIWGVGVVRQSQFRKRTLEALGTEGSGGDTET